MTTRPPDATGLGWDAVSPAIGPLPAIYVHVPAPTGGTMSGILADLRYSQDHLWVRPDPGGGLVDVGHRNRDDLDLVVHQAPASLR